MESRDPRFDTDKRRHGQYRHRDEDAHHVRPHDNAPIRNPHSSPQGETRFSDELYRNESARPQPPQSPKVNEGSADAWKQRCSDPLTKQPPKPRPITRSSTFPHEQSAQNDAGRQANPSHVHFTDSMRPSPCVPVRPERPESLELDDFIKTTPFLDLFMDDNFLDFCVRDFRVLRTQIKSVDEQSRIAEVKLDEAAYEVEERYGIIDNLRVFEVLGCWRDLNGTTYVWGEEMERTVPPGEMIGTKDQERPEWVDNHKDEKAESDSSSYEESTGNGLAALELEQEKIHEACPELEPDSGSDSTIESFEGPTTTPPAPSPLPKHAKAGPANYISNPLRDSGIPDLKLPYLQARAAMLKMQEHMNADQREARLHRSNESGRPATSITRGDPRLSPKKGFLRSLSRGGGPRSPPNSKDAGRETSYGDQRSANEDAQATCTTDLSWGNVGNSEFIQRTGSPLPLGKPKDFQRSESPLSTTTASPRSSMETRWERSAQSREDYSSQLPESPAPYRIASPLSSVTNSPLHSKEGKRHEYRETKPASVRSSREVYMPPPLSRRPTVPKRSDSPAYQKIVTPSSLVGGREHESWKRQPSSLRSSREVHEEESGRSRHAAYTGGNVKQRQAGVRSIMGQIRDRSDTSDDE